MLSLAKPSSKEYIERGVQTDLSANRPPSPASATVTMDVLSDVTPAQLPSESSPVVSSHSRSSTQFDSAYSHDHTDISFDSVSSEANRSMTTTTRVYKRVQLPTNRPSTLLERHSSSRVFSLPEVTPKFRMKNILVKKTPRVVSMPSAPPNATDSLDISTHAGDPFGSDDEEHTRVRVKSQATDVPYTPSAPSSPESVEIIANHSNQLSNDFLRPRRDASSSPESEDEDWLTWAESPPRPIPALHGPLSLPYARCPSGAEGTIIEEPESMPRVIWGLDPNDAKASRPSHHAVSAHAAPKRSIPSADVHDRQKWKQAPKPPMAQVTQPAPVQPSSRAPQVPKSVAPRPAPQQLPQQLPQPPDFILKHSEPIDLGRLVANTPEAAHYTPSATGHSHHGSRWQTPLQHQLPTPELVHDLSPELQAMIFAQGRLRNHGISPSLATTPPDLNGLLNPALSASSSVSLLDSIKSSRSPIVLDDLTPYGLYSQGLSAQMSVLGLGHPKARQQQQLHGLLPTPPSSTSPIWSSSFSPYQSGLLSPELLAAAAGLSPLNPQYLSYHAMQPRLDHSHHALGSNGGLSGIHLPTARKLPDGLAPPAQINNGAQRLPPRLAAEYARRRAGGELPADGQQFDNDLGRQLASPVRGASQSPMVPKPPPNTPYSAKRPDSRAQSSLLAVPPSPTSPHEAQSLGLSHPGRSIPLNKLMQRRLSSVPEEDYVSNLEHGRTPGAHTRGTGIDSSGLHLYLSPSGRSNANAASLALLGDALETHYGTQAAPSVKLPSASGRTSGPVGRIEAQAVKEGHRRQGSGNANKDGGQRSDSGRGRGQKRGGRGRRGRGGGFHAASLVHGAERVDGGMMVKS